jgi:methionyl-tRNA formyltransferase
MKILLFGKQNKFGIKEVVEYLKTNFGDEVTIFLGERQDVFPAVEYNLIPHDILISYLSPWIIPEEILNRTKLWNINFHPGPPNYPGVGCANFALYNMEKLYGVTAHLMEKKVDSGKIIGVKRFSILENDNVYTLTLKSYAFMLSLFFEILDYIINNNKLPECHEKWTRAPYTRKQLEELCIITPDMSEEEVKKRIKATRFPGMPGAFIKLYNYKFEYNENR